VNVLPRFFEEIPDLELGRFGLITSVMAATRYSPRPIFVINKMLRLRGIISRVIFDLRKTDLIIRQDGRTISLVDWVIDQLKGHFDLVEAYPSYESPDTVFFLIGDADTGSFPFQIPEPKFVRLAPDDVSRILAVP
jgi:hypothetical protein